MKTGAQLYTIRAYTQNEKDFARSMKRIAQTGYRTVQISAVGKDIRPERIREICDENGLEIVLTHSDVNRILYDTDRLIAEHDVMGCRYIGIGAMPDRYRAPEWLAHFAEDFREPARKIADAGKLLMYHNHNFEFRRIQAEGEAQEKRIIEYLCDWFGPRELGFTLDTYWVQAAGADVCQWIGLLAGRNPRARQPSACAFPPEQRPLSDTRRRPGCHSFALGSRRGSPGRCPAPPADIRSSSPPAPSG